MATLPKSPKNTSSTATIEIGGAETKGRRWHYAWVISIVTFVVLLVAAGVRTAPSIFIKPMEGEFGWSRGSISLAVAVSLFAFGYGGPLAGSMIDKYGPRRVMVAGLSLIIIGLAPLLWLSSLWQLHIFWGLITGVGTGMVATVMGATVADRWFKAHRGLVVGLFGAASSAGQLIFLPALSLLTDAAGWRWAIGTMLIAASLLLLPAALLMRNRPQDIGLLPIGDDGKATAANTAPIKRTTMAEAIRTRDFWLLAGSFFICGYTSNGLVGTHLIPHCIEHGFTSVSAASAVALMGAMNIVGTLASGWLSERFDNRKLLAFYYGFRAIALIGLPFVINMEQLLLFAVLYGLDWIATVPPTVNLTAQRFGKASLGTIFGWIFCAHMIGAGLATYAGGFFHDVFGDYHLIFLSASLIGFMAVALSLSIAKPRKLVAA